jgi:chromosome segregation ATPase
MKIDWKWLATICATGVLLLLVYFGKQYMGKIDRIDEKFQLIVVATEDTKKIKELELPAIKKELSDQRTILLTLASGSAALLTPQFKELLDRFIKSAIRQELTPTTTAISKIQNAQADLSQTLTQLTSETKSFNKQLQAVASLPPEELKTHLTRLDNEFRKLTELIEKQQRLTVATSLYPSYLAAMTKVAKKGDIVATKEGDFRVSDPRALNQTKSDIYVTLKGLGVEPVEFKTKSK